MAYLIAEAGVNHNGDTQKALAMVDVAADAGANAVKFQTFRSEALVSASATKAPYQIVPGEDNRQLAMLKALELPQAAHFILRDRCATRGIDFLSTPFDLGSLRFLVDEINVTTLKLGSGEITNGPLLVAAGRSGKHIILSTGMSTLAEVRIALGALAYGILDQKGRPTASDFHALVGTSEGRKALAGRVTLLHCTSAYPAPPEEVNLRAMMTMTQAFDLPTGLSDHTVGTAVSIAAVAMGATMIEKHFTLDRNLPGPDHRASLEPLELRALVSAIRKIEVALGDGIKRPTTSELTNIVAARRSLVTARSINHNELFNDTSLVSKRPATGVSPMEYWSWLGRVADRDYAADELIAP